MKTELHDINALLASARSRANRIAESVSNPTQSNLDKLAEQLNEAGQRLENLLRDSFAETPACVKREHDSLSDEELQDYYANALATRRGAGGHGKAHYNGLRVDAYLAEMNARGQKPDGREGSFNGIGSY